MGVEIVVRPIEAHEWELLREIRLRALAEATDAFITTHDEAAAYPDDVWRERAEVGSLGKAQLTVLAFRNGVPVGMAVGLWRDRNGHPVVPVVGVFVAEEARRLGVGRALMTSIEAWAFGRGAGALSLWVVDDNHGARALYESLGFRETSDRKAITVGRPRWETRLEKLSPV